MKVQKYLTVNNKGNTKISTGKPRLMPNEIFIQLNLDIPDQLFLKPTLVADISVDESIATQPLISADVIDNAKKLVSDALGLELRVTTVEQEVE